MRTGYSHILNILTSAIRIRFILVHHCLSVVEIGVTILWYRLTAPVRPCCRRGLKCRASRIVEPVAVRLHIGLSLSLSSTHHGVGVVPGLLEVARPADG